MRTTALILVALIALGAYGQSLPEVKAKFIDGTTTDPYEYKLFVPEGYTNSKSYGLVVWLAGIGERGKENGVQLIRTPLYLGQDAVQSKWPTFILAPMLPSGSWKGANIKTLIDHVSGEYNIDQTRLFITGFSWGSFGTWDTLRDFPTLFKRAVPIAGGRNIDVALLRNVKIWTFHGEADNIVGWGPTRNTVNAMIADGQDVKFTHEATRGHEDAYVWTNYPTAEWLLEYDAPPPTCTPACTTYQFCTVDGCKCPPSFFGSDCRTAYLGPEDLANEGEGGSHLMIQKTPALASGFITSFEGYFNKGTPGGSPPSYELRIYQLVSGNTFSLVHKQPLEPVTGSVNLQTVVVDPPIQIEKGQYVGLTNLGGALGMANNEGAGTGYFYVSSPPSEVIGSEQTVSNWNGAAPWHVTMIQGPADYTNTEGIDDSGASPSGISILLIAVTLFGYVQLF